MYGEMGLLPPCLQELHPLQEELLWLLQSNTDGPCLVDNAGRDLVPDYDLAAGDLFKAPESIIEEPIIEFDPATTATSMMPHDDDAVTAEGIKVADIYPIQSEQLLSEILYDCNEPLARCESEDIFYELSDVKIRAQQIEKGKTTKTDEILGDEPIQKSASSGCLTSVDWTSGMSVRPNFPDFQCMDLGSIFGIRRTYSRGDIQKIEERRRKISRYRKKKTKRNFDRKIKYACRKALADTQPRIRGRFAKVEDCEASKWSTLTCNHS